MKWKGEGNKSKNNKKYDKKDYFFLIIFMHNKKTRLISL